VGEAGNDNVCVYMMCIFLLCVFVCCRGSNMSTVEKALAKATREKLFLGLDRTWLSK
jgi:hypothetical protein